MVASCSWRLSRKSHSPTCLPPVFVLASMLPRVSTTNWEVVVEAAPQTIQPVAFSHLWNQSMWFGWLRLIQVGSSCAGQILLLLPRHQAQHNFRSAAAADARCHPNVYVINTPCIDSFCNTHNWPRLPMRMLATIATSHSLQGWGGVQRPPAAGLWLRDHRGLKKLQVKAGKISVIILNRH